MADKLNIEVVFALPNRQRLVELQLDAGATIAEAIEASGLNADFEDVDFSSCEVGVWSKPKPRDHVLRDKDRVEIYRPLTVDPKRARRQRARKRTKERGGTSKD